MNKVHSVNGSGRLFGKLIIVIWILSEGILAAAAADNFIWTGGTCCGQNQPQYIHNPDALVSYFLSPGPNNSPGAYTTCNAPPTALGQSCYVYAWSTHLPYTSEANCPIDPLPEIPKNDLCSLSLEQGSGEDVNNACTSSLDDRWNKPSGGQMQCLADKFSKLALISRFTKPSATIRTTTYQNHLLAVWNKLEEVKLKDLTDTQKQACASIIADVNNHQNIHGIKAKPSESNDQAPHVLGKAIDVPENLSDELISKVTQYSTVNLQPICSFCVPITTVTSDVESYVQSATVNPPACNVRWGGRFTPYDPIHFQLP